VLSFKGKEHLIFTVKIYALKRTPLTFDSTIADPKHDAFIADKRGQQASAVRFWGGLI